MPVDFGTTIIASKNGLAHRKDSFVKIPDGMVDLEPAPTFPIAAAVRRLCDRKLYHNHKCVS